jgi:hypothetical protein
MPSGGLIFGNGIAGPIGYSGPSRLPMIKPAYLNIAYNPRLTQTTTVSAAPREVLSRQSMACAPTGLNAIDPSSSTTLAGSPQA